MSLRLFVSLLVLFCFVLPASAAQPLVELLEAGSGTKKELRLSPKVGATESLKMVLELQMGMDMGKAPRITKVPPMDMVLSARVTDVKDGTIRYTVELTGSELQKVDTSKMTDEDRKLFQGVSSQLGQLVGTTGTVVVTDRGQLVSTDLKAPPGNAERQFLHLKRGLAHASIPFPSEPVGVGARWKVVEPVKESGLHLEQTAIYTLKGFEGNSASIEVTIEHSATGQDVMKPELPEGSSASLVALDSKGNNTTRVDTGKLFPASGEVKHDLEARVVIGQQQGGMEIGTTMQLDMSLQRL